MERLVKPLDTAQAVTFECADSYTTSLFREELKGDDVLLACKLNGEVLEEGYGFPVRLVVPSKYAYKSALWVVHVRFTRGKELGFWERRGYSDSADVWKNDRFRRYSAVFQRFRQRDAAGLNFKGLFLIHNIY